MTVNVTIPASGTKLSADQVQQLCVRYGGKTGLAAHAASIIMAESGGRTNAVNFNCRDRATGRNYSSSQNVPDAISVDRGIWQINNYWHPEVSDAAAFDPEKATQHAFRISHGFQDFSAWATNGTARQKQYERIFIDGIFNGQLIDIEKQGQASPIAAATGAVGGVLYGAGQGVVDAGKGALSGIDAVGAFAASLGQRSTWVRVLEVVGGVAAVFAGVWMLNASVVRGAAATVAEARGMGVPGAAAHITKSTAKAAARAVAG